jgi:hypothetical protein
VAPKDVTPSWPSGFSPSLGWTDEKAYFRTVKSTLAVVRSHAM